MGTGYRGLEEVVEAVTVTSEVRGLGLVVKFYVQTVKLAGRWGGGCRMVVVQVWVHGQSYPVGSLWTELKLMISQLLFSSLCP